MASVAPSIILAITVVGVMISILGGVIAYYTKIYSEPDLLPTYGTIYVDYVDYDNCKVIIDNNYGYPVRVLFSIRILAINNMTENIPDYCTFWYEIKPGINDIDLMELTKVNLHLGANDTLVIDMYQSYFLIGNTKFYLRFGEGALEPVSVFSNMSNSFTVQGIGVSRLSNDNTRFASIMFDGNSMTIGLTSSTWLGYRRSISDFGIVKKEVFRSQGYHCKSYGITRWGEENSTCLDQDCYNNCINNGGTDEECTKNCSYPCCVSCSKPITWSYKVWKVSSSYDDFMCATDDVPSYYWTNEIKSEISKVFHTAALSGFSHFIFGVDNATYTIPGTDYISKDWPYILSNQSACNYTYILRTYTATTYDKDIYVCDDICGYKDTERLCSESYTDSNETRWACGNQECAGQEKYLYGRLRNGNMTVISSLSSGESIKLKVNISLLYDYYRYYDQELDDQYIRVTFRDILTITLPKITGYIGIPYTEQLSSLDVSLDVKVTNVRVYIYSSDLNETIIPKVETQTSTGTVVFSEAVGYVTQNAKTYRYETQDNPIITIKIESPSQISLPLKSLDSIKIVIVFDISITPVLQVFTEVAP